MTELRLRPLREEDEAQARQAHGELSAEEFTFLLDWDPTAPWADHVRDLELRRCGLRVPEGWVPATFLVAGVGGGLVGRVSVRHRLTDRLAVVGGRIGYAVRPAHRGRGYATEMLRQALVVARSHGVDDVLLTCDDTNAASAAVITRCGGVLDGVHVDQDGRRLGTGSPDGARSPFASAAGPPRRGAEGDLRPRRRRHRRRRPGHTRAVAVEHGPPAPVF